MKSTLRSVADKPASHGKLGLILLQVTPRLFTGNLTGSCAISICHCAVPWPFKYGRVGELPVDSQPLFVGYHVWHCSPSSPTIA